MNLFFKSMIAIVIVGSSFAFTSIQNEGLEVTYGVSADDPSSIELRLNKDFSFNYQDFSNPKQKIKVQGTYTLKNRKVQLTSQDASPSFHDKWKFSEEGTKASSRKGLAFYTLSKK